MWNYSGGLRFSYGDIQNSTRNILMKTLIKKTKTNKELDYINSQASYVISKALAQSMGEKPTNKVIELKDGCISFNPTTDVGKETALVFKGEYFILLGDFRKDLVKCKNINECVLVFKQLIKKGKKVSPWNTFDYKSKK